MARPIKRFRPFHLGLLAKQLSSPARVLTTLSVDYRGRLLFYAVAPHVDCIVVAFGFGWSIGRIWIWAYLVVVVEDGKEASDVRERREEEEEFMHGWRRLHPIASLKP